jgi:hypothetical protein
MLTVRIQVIDGTGTFTLSDSQPCRLPTLLQPHYRLGGAPPKVGGVVVFITSSNIVVSARGRIARCQADVALGGTVVSLRFQVRQKRAKRVIKYYAQSNRRLETLSY